MRAEINAEELHDLVREAVEAKYCGDAYTLERLELQVNSPRGKTRFVTAEIEITPIKPRAAPSLSAVAE